MGLGFFENDGQAIEEGVAVLIVSEKLPSFNSPGHDVLEEAGGIKSGLAGHLNCYGVLGEHRVVKRLFL